jgi:hypothetical protein
LYLITFYGNFWPFQLEKHTQVNCSYTNLPATANKLERNFYFLCVCAGDLTKSVGIWPFVSAEIEKGIK